MKMIRKIHIIGGAGSGKTYAAGRIAEMLGIRAHDLDNIFWDNTDKSYNLKAIPEVRDKRLEEILLTESWIIEGVYYQWLKESFQQADVIIILKPHYIICTFRIISRFIKRKIGIIPSKKKETIQGLIELIQWNQRYNKEDIPDIIRLLKPYNDKMRIFSKADDAVDYINGVFSRPGAQSSRPANWKEPKETGLP
jgi:adenylate kinase family enzyme